MKQTIQKAYKSLTYNLKTLIYFEVIYRVIGLLMIFPAARFLFYTSVRLSGYAYITNQLFFTYLLKPSTILMLFLLFVLLSVYLVIEMVFLSLIYDFGYHQENISFKNLIIIGLKKSYHTIKKYHIFIIIPAFLIFFAVQLFHLSGIYSTISLPEQMIIELNRLTFLKNFLFFIGGFFIILFFESVFTINLFTIENLSYRDSFSQNHKMKKRYRLSMIFEFTLVNITVNALFYGIYVLIILSIGWIVSITQGQAYVLGVLLTIMYAVYAVIGLISSTFLIPINYALISTWYYTRREQLGLQTKHVQITSDDTDLFPFKTLKRVTAGLLVLLFTINISSIVSIIREDRVPLEIINYAEIVAHRGSSLDAPENTLAALELAIEQGSDAVEFDVRETTDRFPVLFHDPTTGRTTNDALDRSISSLTLAQVKDLDAGGWFSEEYEGEKIPTLEEAIALVSGRVKAFIELKSLSLTLERQTVRIIEEYRMVYSSVVLSFDRNQLERIKDINPDIKTLLLVPIFYGNINVMLDNEYIDYYGFSRDIIDENPHYVNLAHQKEKLVYIWNITSEQEFIEAVDIDIDGIITSRPHVAREIAYTKNTSTILQDFLKEFFNRE